MVKKNKILLVSFVFLFLSTAYSNGLVLTAQDVAHRVIHQSFRGQEIDLIAELARINKINQEKKFDWTLNLESGREDSQFDSLTGSSFSWGDRSLKTQLNLNKNWITGTTTSVDFSQASLEYDLLPGVTQSDTQNQWITSVTVVQSLWRNFFGNEWRQDLQAQENFYQVSRLQKVEDAENLILESLQKFWDLVVSNATYEEAIRTRDRYVKLLENVKRKQSLGFANPGELAQVQAEFEGREQGVLKSRINYLQNKEAFSTFLRLEREEKNFEIKYNTDKISPPPAFENLNIESLRPLEISKLKVLGFEAQHKGSQSRQGPDLSFVGRVGIAGVDPSNTEAQTEWMRAEKQKMYLGVRLSWEWGSQWREEEERNRFYTKEIELIRNQKLKREIEDFKNHLQRKIETIYQLSLSLKKQKDFRKKAIDELTRSYQLGRIEIRTLIESINASHETEMEYLRNLGQYQVALAEWQSLKDQLIVEISRNN